MLFVCDSTRAHDDTLARTWTASLRVEAQPGSYSCWYGSRLVQGTADRAAVGRIAAEVVTQSLLPLFFALTQRVLPSSLLNTFSSYSFLAHVDAAAVNLSTTYRCTVPLRALGTASLRVETQPRSYSCWYGIAWFLAATASPAAHRSLTVITACRQSCCRPEMPA